MPVYGLQDPEEVKELGEEWCTRVLMGIDCGEIGLPIDCWGWGWG